MTTIRQFAEVNCNCQAARRICSKILVNPQLIRIVPCQNMPIVPIVRAIVEELGNGGVLLLHCMMEQPDIQRTGRWSLSKKLQRILQESAGGPEIIRAIRSKASAVNQREGHVVGVVVVHRSHPVVRKWLMNAADPELRLPRVLRSIVSDYWPFVAC